MSASHDELAALQARHDALLAELHAGVQGGRVSDDARARLKQEIAMLFLTVDRRLAALARLREDVKGLVGAWKELPVAPEVPAFLDDAPHAPIDGAPVPAMRARAPVAEHASVRVDHLGASTFVAKGWSAISMGEFARAEETLARALELAPDDPEGGALLAWALMGQGRLDEARETCERVLARSPDFTLARVNLGYICLRRGEHVAAVEHLAGIAHEDVDRKAMLYATFYLGLVSLQRGVYDDAVGFFRRALELGPNLLEACYEMGRAHWLAGDREAAREAWRAGATSGKFNAWGARCADVLERVEQGGEPPPLD
ncbi:MAG: tetratricopeptide repeat protein [Gemmatirosa sp.]